MQEEGQQNPQPNSAGSMAQQMNAEQEDRLEQSLHEIKEAKVKPSYLWLLIRKNLLLTFKNPKNLLFLIIAPFLLSSILFLFQYLADDANTKEYIDDNPVLSTIQFPQCYGNDCVSLSYTVAGTDQTQSPWVSHVIDYIKKNSNLPDSTVRRTRNVATDSDWEEYNQNITDNQNKTQIGLVFCGSGAKIFSLWNCNSTDLLTSYVMVLNRTSSYKTIFYAQNVPLPKDPVAFSLKLLVDNAILDYKLKLNKTSNKIKYSTLMYPVVQNRFISGFDIITQTGAFYYLITPLFAFLFMQTEVVREKQYRLRQGLNVFGAPHFAYWFSWFFISIIYSLVVALSTIAAGAAFQFRYFLDTPFLIILLFMFCFCLAMQMVSFFLATVCPNLKSANSISYGLVLFAIVVESFTTNENLLVFIFEDNPSDLIEFLKYFLCLYPPFSYTAIFTSITAYVGNHFNMQTNRWEPGPGYNWSTFASQKKAKTIEGSPYTEFSGLAFVGIMLIDIFIFALLTWYFDNVLESNRGRGEKLWFFLQPSYWGFSRKSKVKSKITVDDLRNPQVNIRDEEESVTRERLRVMRNFNGRLPALGMRIKDLSKTFVKLCSKERVQALKNLTLEIQSNELMSILGHNGAGKTTLINILTGIISPDQNENMEIVINNKSITKLDEVRKYIGVCPQFDILWGEMTAEEHLSLFGQLKGIPKENLDNKINDILHFVSLSKQKKNKVSSFSGGMKRRLSLAIAAIGNPKIIFLDEPTTGLDPKVRQQVWSLIERLKKHKSVILTTHSMEEADILSDRISILVKGKLKCIGTSIYLKENYGSGYRIALNVTQNKSAEVIATIKRMFPEASEVDSNGGNLLVGIQHYDNLLAFVKMLEAKECSGLDEYVLKQNIKDWNVSHTTLEEVFMKVTKHKDQEVVE